MRLFNRDALEVKPLAERKNKLSVADNVRPDSPSVPLSDQALGDIQSIVSRLHSARRAGASRMLVFGAHSIKNGLADLLIHLMEKGDVTHLATNGAGIIHDWEFAFQGQTGENVEHYTAEGQFGIWEETGKFLNLALIIGAYRGLGYGQSVGTMVQEGGLRVPGDSELFETLRRAAGEAADAASADRAAAAADLLETKRHFHLGDGFISIPHRFAEHSVAAAAVRLGVPFTCHPMIGHDIIYTHPMNKPAAIGRTAERDFLSFADSVSRLEHGIYLSVGSAVMSPMIFEKSLSMSRNLARQRGESITDFDIHVVDLAASTWDWTTQGEPPQDNPAYYLRFCKTFSRMGGKMTYTSADNRSWLLEILRRLDQTRSS